MTFLEAAIEVLRHEAEALHFSDIAKKAVERKLLSHVGRDPEGAMRSCLNSAVRGGADALVERSKPGFYQIRPGAPLPEPVVAVVATPSRAAVVESDDTAVTRRRPGSRSGGPREGLADDAAAEPRRSRSRRPRSRSREAKATPAGVDATDAIEGDDIAETDEVGAGEAETTVEFEAPSGSGLDGVTDVAIVMANAMSRLAEERPELREELEAMQNRQPEDQFEPGPGAGPIIQTKPTRARREDPEERGGRRRRRRRRRARRVEWSDGATGRSGAAGRADELLDKVAGVLGDAGARSLHVRQIAETLASQNVLGGEISEIERAVTSAMLLDVQRRGRASRFVVRGDARYQLQGSRIPEGAAKAEKVFREALSSLEAETRVQLMGWLQTLGARALESLVRIYLQRESFNLVATLAPGRGLGKLVAEDPEGEDEDAKVLVLVVPKRTSLEPKLWDGEAERNQCASTLVFSMSDTGVDRVGETGRVMYAPEFADWLIRNEIGVQRVRVDVPVLDAAVIESIGGLDT